jgi:tRNA-specific adenosine deaminase 1
MAEWDEIVACALQAFRASRYFHTFTASNFTVFAAIVLHHPDLYASSLDNQNLKLVAWATGSKCIPDCKRSPSGDILHDSHAETLVRRAAVRWLLEEIHRCQMLSRQSLWLRRASFGGKWTLRDSIRVNMYISTLPCETCVLPFMCSLKC